jgi:predicted ATPase/class 3 adenylate cyclase
MDALPGDVATLSMPTGTVTFAFTDIEGSTQRWDRDRAAMEKAVQRHDALMREAIAAHHGKVFKTIGDAFCASFSRPEDAVAAMFDVQNALAAEDFSAVGGLRVRAAVHTGTADERDQDYFGPAVNRVARLLAIGHGGQVLLSGVTSRLVQGSLPAQASLRELGEHRLKDLSQPETVYQLTGPTLIADFPPLRSLNAHSNNLPLKLTSFVGRETEITDIVREIERHRLVTIVGSGGVGKTRTALQAAAQLVDGSGDGVWLIELAPLGSGTYVASTIAQTLGISLGAEADPLDDLTHSLKAKRMLLVFDNCEHLVDESARVISALLRGCPEVKVLATSLQGLGIAGEVTYRLSSLQIPPRDEDGPLGVAEAASYSAIALFVERAQNADRRFELTEENAPIVADICRRLDGIALAIELAAPRIKILSPRQLRDRLNELFHVCTGGSRDALPHHKTLRALIDWSHQLLDERERTLFRRLGMFVGGFTLEGACAVAGGDDLVDFDVFDLIASLVEKSLVLAEPGGDALRYRLLQSTRAYAREQLTAARELDAVADRHIDYLCDLFKRAGTAYEATLSGNRLAELAVELDDARAALDWAVERKRVDAAADLLLATLLWDHLGLHYEATQRARQYIDLIGDGDPVRVARLWERISLLSARTGHFTRACEAAEHAVACARISGSVQALAEALARQGTADTLVGRFDEAQASLDEAERVAPLTSRLKHQLSYARGLLAHFRGDFAEAALCYERFRDLCVAAGNRLGVVSSSMNLAEMEYRRGETARAVQVAKEALEDAKQLPDRGLAMGLLRNLSAYLAANDELVAARSIATEVAGYYERHDPDGVFAAITVELLALVSALEGDLERAAFLEGYADDALRTLGFQRGYTEERTYDRLQRLIGTPFTDEASRDHFARGARASAAAVLARATA